MTRYRDFTPGDAGYFSIDEETGQLLWKKQIIQTESRVVLSGRQSFWAIIVAIFTAVGAVAGSFSAFAAMSFKPLPPVQIKEGQPVQIDAVSVVCSSIVEVDKHRRVQRVLSQQCTETPPGVEAEGAALNQPTQEVVDATP